MADKQQYDYSQIASTLIHDEHGYKLFLHWKGAWLIWDGATYVRANDRRMTQHIYQFEILRGLTRFQREELLYHMQQQSLLDDDATVPCFMAEPFRRRDDVVVAQNGRFIIDDLLAGCFAPVANSSDFITEVALPYAIAPGATCPRWEQFMGEVFDDDQQRIDLFQQWAGYLLVPDVKYEKFVALVGRGENGKTKAAQVLRDLVGEKNTASVTIDTISRQFGLMALAGRRLILVNEPDESSRAEEGIIKGLVTGEPRTIDRKYQAPVEWVPQVKLMIVCNRLPQFRDRTEGMRRRCIIIPFNRRFVGEQRDLDLGDKLRKELPGIFLWALQGLARLRADGGFIEPVVCADAQDEHFRAADPLGQFIRDNLVVKAGDEIRVAELVGRLNSWCKDCGYKSEFSAATVGRELREHFRAEIDVGYRKLTARDGLGRREHAWTNIAWFYEVPEPGSKTPAELAADMAANGESESAIIKALDGQGVDLVHAMEIVGDLDLPVRPLHPIKPRLSKEERWMKQADNRRFKQQAEQEEVARQAEDSMACDQFLAAAIAADKSTETTEANAVIEVGNG